jgi:hypothetical protein
MSTLKVTNIAPQSGSDVYLTGSLTISETLIAKEIRTELTQSVTLLQSGSTQFGDTSDDTHTFTGSLVITGSTTQAGTIDVTGATSKVRFLYADTGSLPAAADYHGMFAHVHAEGAAFFAHGGNWVELANSSSFSSSIAALSASIGTEVAALTGSFSSSVSTRLSTEEANVDALQTDSASFSTRITTAELELGNTLLSSSAQIAGDISGSFTSTSASLATDIATNLASITALDDTYATDAQVLAQTASLSSSLATGIATNTADIVSLTGATGSYVTNASTASFASTGSNTYTGNQVVSASILLTLQQLTGSSPVGVSTGSLIVSGSPVQLYIYNGSGSGWNRV